MILVYCLPVICINGFEHCGTQKCHPALRAFRYSDLCGLKALLMCKRVTPRYLCPSNLTTGVLRYIVSARRRASSLSRFRGPLSGIPAPFFLTFSVWQVWPRPKDHTRLIYLQSDDCVLFGFHSLDLSPGVHPLVSVEGGSKHAHVGVFLYP